MTVEPMTDAELADPWALFRRWADYMRDERIVLHTLAGVTISASLLDRVVADLDAIVAERDAERTRADRECDRVVELIGERVGLMLQLDDAKRALTKAEAERDAAVAREAERDADADGWFLRAMAAIGKLPAETLRGDLQAAYAEAEARLLPKPRLVRTVEEVGALTIGAYRIAPPWRTRQWILGRRHPPGTWTLLIDTGASGVTDDYIVGSWVQRLPDLPTPTAAQEG